MQSGNGQGAQLAEVSAVADAILAQGQRPRGECVRRQLGRGSPNTVGPMLEVRHAPTSDIVCKAQAPCSTLKIWSAPSRNGNKLIYVACAVLAAISATRTDARSKRH
jgi:hypothetical protein